MSLPEDATLADPKSAITSQHSIPEAEQTLLAGFPPALQRTVRPCRRCSAAVVVRALIVRRRRHSRFQRRRRWWRWSTQADRR